MTSINRNRFSISEKFVHKISLMSLNLFGGITNRFIAVILHEKKTITCYLSKSFAHIQLERNWRMRIKSSVFFLFKLTYQIKRSTRDIEINIAKMILIESFCLQDVFFYIPIFFLFFLIILSNSQAYGMVGASTGKKEIRTKITPLNATNEAENSQKSADFVIIIFP